MLVRSVLLTRQGCQAKDATAQPLRTGGCSIPLRCVEDMTIVEVVTAMAVASAILTRVEVGERETGWRVGRGHYRRNGLWVG